MREVNDTVIQAVLSGESEIEIPHVFCVRGVYLAKLR